ncbi:sodium-coupled monocarboxylate transporter 1-like [Branchiostoma floridae]|uniref:Sodium-coupled monocarboxylate transporter 1-like n=1 Tax=Branchiostoma floridae TaxID=7739 RepID=A0A9J7HNY2_BRAFL|nr:sodium-coupled monocarboxylate transporter 1-like [Branchiostoma floridae]
MAAEGELQFSGWDYAVFSVMFGVSVAIGFYYACTGGKQRTQREYLMADRSMSVLPVSLSLLASFMSALTVLGTPAEVYTNGTMYWMFAVTYVIVIVLTAHLFLPTFYRLGVTSTNEYLEKRFNKAVRTLGAIFFTINMIIYMGLVLYAPSLALNAVTGLNLWVAVLTMGIVCTFYTAIGGMKAVMWTDTFQVCVMLAGFLAVIIQGTLVAGGWGHVWETARQGHRIEFFNWDPDPKVRHSTWTVWVGGVFVFTAVYGVNQAQVQRYCSCATLRKAQTALYLNILGLGIILTLACMSGLVIYARYHDCDPRLAGHIFNSDQLMPYLTMDLLGHLPGMPGLFTAAVFSAAISTMSSGLNSLAAVTLEDFTKPLTRSKGWSDLRYTVISKVLVFTYGSVMIMMSYMASFLGSIIQAGLSMFGTIGGPILGIFVLGMLFPCANGKGGFAGLFCSLVITMWLGFGQFVHPYPRWKPPLSIAGCIHGNGTGNVTSAAEMTTVAAEMTTVAAFDVTTAAMSTSGSSPGSGIYGMSYLWLGGVGVLSCVVIGLAVSFITGAQDPKKIDPKLISPFFDQLCCCLPLRVRKTLRCGVKHGETISDFLPNMTSTPYKRRPWDLDADDVEMKRLSRDSRSSDRYHDNSVPVQELKNELIYYHTSV